MKITIRRWMGMGFLSWFGLLLIVLAGMSGCITVQVDGYPALLGSAKGPGVLIWPGNAGGTTFHCLVAPANELLSDDDRATSFDWPGDIAQALPKSIGSATVLLDPLPGVELRARVSDLLRAIEQANPQVSTSVTVCAQPLGQVSDVKTLTAAVARIYTAALQQRQEDSLQPLIEFDESALGREGNRRSRIVVPNADVPGEYFLVRSNTSDLAYPLFDEVTPDVSSVGPETVLENVDDDCVYYFVEPWQTPSAVSESMHLLAEKLTPQPRPDPYAKARWLRWPLLYSEVTSAQAVRRALQGRTSDCTCQYCKAGIQP